MSVKCHDAWPRIALTVLIQSVISYQALAAEPTPGMAVSFLACPIARDTGAETDLCFFAEHNGTRYALVNPPDWGAPQLRHRVLVEGRVKEGPKVCGATPLDGRASVIVSEIDATCNVIVPFDGVITGSAGGVFLSGSPKQRAYAEDLARRAKLDPSLSLEPAILDPQVAPKPTLPYEKLLLVITYPFDSNRGSGPDMVKLKDLATYARASKFSTVRVIGYLATSELTDGTALTEKADLAQSRATKIARILVALGVEEKVIRIRWNSEPIAGKGEDDWRNRKVEVSAGP